MVRKNQCRYNRRYRPAKLFVQRMPVSPYFRTGCDTLPLCTVHGQFITSRADECAGSYKEDFCLTSLLPVSMEAKLPSRQPNRPLTLRELSSHRCTWFLPTAPVRHAPCQTVRNA